MRTYPFYAVRRNLVLPFVLLQLRLFNHFQSRFFNILLCCSGRLGVAQQLNKLPKRLRQIYVPKQSNDKRLTTMPQKTPGYLGLR